MRGELPSIINFDMPAIYFHIQKWKLLILLRKSDIKTYHNSTPPLKKNVALHQASIEKMVW